MERGVWLVLAMAAGVAIGKNWGKISKFVGPYGKGLEDVTVKGYNTVVRFVAEQKEHVEDMIAAGKVRKAKPQIAERRVVRKPAVRARKRVRMAARVVN